MVILRQEFTLAYLRARQSIVSAEAPIYDERDRALGLRERDLTEVINVDIVHDNTSLGVTNTCGTCWILAYLGQNGSSAKRVIAR